MEMPKVVNQVTKIYVHFQKFVETQAKFFSRIVELRILSRKTLEISENAHFECPDHLAGVHHVYMQKKVNKNFYPHF